MITTVHEHSYDSELLPERANILDLGCRGFLFTKYFRNLWHNVVAVDIDFFIPSGEEEEYTKCGITDYDGQILICRSVDPQATRVAKVSLFHSFAEKDLINCYTLASFSKIVGIDFWDLIKIDVEGSEYQIIMSLDKAPAKQLSIEFHLHTGIYGHYEMTLMEDKLKALGYYPAKHEMTSEHGAGFNYWDSLFILK